MAGMTGLSGLSGMSGLFGGFRPNKLDNLELWLRADAGTSSATDGDPVSQWDDQSGNARHAAQATVANQPVYKTAIINGRPVLRFDGTDDFLDLSSVVSLTDFTVFVVARLPSTITAATSPQIVLGSQTAGATNDGATFFSLGATTSSLTDERICNVANNGSAVWGVGYTGGDIAAGNHIIGTELNGTTESIRLNGQSLALDTGAGGGLDSSDPERTWNKLGRIGANQFPASYLSGDIAEVIVYSDVLASDERQKVERYLSKRWGVALA